MSGKGDSEDLLFTNTFRSTTELKDIDNERNAQFTKYHEELGERQKR